MCSPIAYSRIVLAPTNEPTFGEMPCACIARSHASKPCGPCERCAAIATVAVSAAMSASVERAHRRDGVRLAEDLRGHALRQLADVASVAAQEADRRTAPGCR